MKSRFEMTCLQARRTQSRFERARLQGVPLKAPPTAWALAPEVENRVRTHPSRTSADIVPYARRDVFERDSAEYKADVFDSRSHPECDDPRTPFARPPCAS